ncbi:MAG: hypothetical protein H7A33_03970 [Deltaproteobacteria bacterium]|nr:hypothetical protein [Deltaproteobacteria bacterium]
MSKLIFSFVVSLLCLLNQAVYACAVCYGDPNSLMAKGANMGIMTLLVIVGVVLALFLSLVVYLARADRAAHK